MHTRLKFRDHRNLSTGTHRDSRTRALVDPGVRDRTSVGKSAMLCGEKRREEYLRCPYRKPTQVDEERILRPTGEGEPEKSGRSEKAQATVYQKHRSLLNRKMTYRG